MSPRRGAGTNVVKINCAAIPSGCLNRTLFGHERGAFTGAVNQKIGRVSWPIAARLFLDEVGRRYSAGVEAHCLRVFAGAGIRGGWAAIARSGGM